MSSAGCTIGLGPQGKLVTGASIYSFSDGTSYLSQGVWYNNAPSFEIYDMDINSGHSANGDYHNHFHSLGLQALLGDNGTDHSPLYGFMNDGYPVYGPYQDEDTLAVSCWQKRDYNDPVTGCVGGERTCVFVDAYDYTKGTTTASHSGPLLNSTITTQSGNVISTDSGIYQQDYFFNATCAAQGGEFLNKNNGHSHDGYGWHYHITVDLVGTPTYPYMAGPLFYGCFKSSTTCRTSVCGDADGDSTHNCTAPL